MNNPTVVTVDNCRCQAEYVNCLCSGFKMYHVEILGGALYAEDYMSGERFVISMLAEADEYHPLERC